MSDSKNFSAEMKKRFSSYPSFVQESIMQSGVQVTSLEELDMIANEFMSQKNGEE